MDLHCHAAKGDLAKLTAALTSGASIDAADKEGRTPLMVAAASATADRSVLQVLLDHGANVNALTTPPAPIELDVDVRATMEEMGIDTSIYDPPKKAPDLDSVLSYAAKHATADKIRFLIDAGADVSYVSGRGYSVLTDAMHRPCEESAEAHMTVVAMLVDAGTPLDVESDYGESPLSVASRRGCFEVVAFLVERGADPQPLGWTPLFHAVSSGDLAGVSELVDQKASLDERDAWERTPFLLSVHAGHVPIAKLLLDRGSDRDATGRCGMTALMYAISQDDAKMLQWLITLGCDIEAADESGNFPLVQAAQENAIACVKVLLEAGAVVDRLNEYEENAISNATSAHIIQMLVAAGADLNDVGSEMRCQLVGSCDEGIAEVSKREYQRHKHRKFGKRNPQRMNNPFWEKMVRNRASAYTGAAEYGETEYHTKPVWCFQRYGHSITQLPDGRFVEVGGEHEDYYDPDFCIYNDVVVHHGDGSFDIFGYPERVFPATDFHSATLVGRHIYLIGSLGYAERRQTGMTPVYRLDIESWSIEQIDCDGEAPGWIHNHQAKLVGDSQIAIRGGLSDDGLEGELVANKEAYLLDLVSRSWRRTG